MMLLGGFIVGVIFLLTPGVGCEQTVEVIAEAGSQAVLPCKCGVKQCDPAAISWSKTDKGTVWRKQRSGLQHWGSNWMARGIQRVKCPHSKYAQGDYSLQINSVMKEDGGVYSCKVETEHHVTEVQVLLRIIQVSISPSAPLWGDSVSVTCSVTPQLEGDRVTWMVNNHPRSTELNSNKKKSVVKERMTDQLTGNWTCILKGKTEGRASATLSVRGIIQPARDDTKVYTAVGSSVTLPCVFSPDLTPTSTVLEKMDVRKNLALDNNPLPSSDKSVPIQEVTFEDEGKYECSGTVEKQRLRRTMQLVVAKIVQSNKKGSVMLTCQLSNASEVTEYEWVHVTYDLNGTKSEGPFLKGQTISPKDNQGEWTCYYYGEKGILGNVTTYVQLMSGQSGQTPGVSSNTGTVIGLGFLLVILLLILAQMYKNHQRRKRILQYPALETIVHTISNEREERQRNHEKM